MKRGKTCPKKKSKSWRKQTRIFCRNMASVWWMATSSAWETSRLSRRACSEDEVTTQSRASWKSGSWLKASSSTLASMWTDFWLGCCSQSTGHRDIRCLCQALQYIRDICCLCQALQYIRDICCLCQALQYIRDICCLCQALQYVMTLLVHPFTPNSYQFQIAGLQLHQKYYITQCEELGFS